MSIEAQLQELKGHVDKQVADKLNGVQKSFNEKTGKVDSELKSQLKGLAEKNESLQKQLDDVIEQSKFGYGKSEQPDISAQVAKLMNEKRETKSGNLWLPEVSGKSLVMKAVADMTDAQLTGDYIRGETRRPGIVELRQRQTHIRELLPNNTMDTQTFRFVEETGGEGSVNQTGPGGTKGQLDYDLEIKDAPVRKIAGYVRVAEELLDDISALQGFLSRRLTKDVRKREDSQLLSGDGTGQNITGLSVNAAAFSRSEQDTNATLIDLFVMAISQLMSADQQVNGILLNPRNFYDLYRQKDADGQYLYTENVARMNGEMAIAGIPVFKNTAVAAGDYFIGDWAEGAEIYDRKGLNVRFFEQDQDNAIKNMITVVAEERLAFPIFRPSAFIQGTIATDIAAIKAV